MRLCLPTLKGFIVLKLDDIICCEIDAAVRYFIWKQNSYRFKTMLEYDQILRDIFLQL
jgi:hypothetical protein